MKENTGVNDNNNNNNDNKDNEKSKSGISWSKAFHIHNTQFIAPLLKDTGTDINNPSNNGTLIKTIIWGVLSMILMTFMIALTLIGTTDGPETIKQFVNANFYAYSDFTKSSVYISVLEIWAMIIGLIWFLPFLILYIFTRLDKNRESNKREYGKEAFMGSFYGFLSPLFLFPMIYAIYLMITPVPLMIQLDFHRWQNPLYAFMAILIIIALIYQSIYNIKVLKISKSIAFLNTLVLFLSIVGLLALLLL
ncbi:MAG: hypothetical protein ACTSVC_06160 [Promethearchaeota archaeon]